MCDEDAKDPCQRDAERENEHPAQDANEPAAESDERPGLPDPDTVVSEETLTSPKGKRYRILKTTETDPYDEEKGEEHRS